MADSDGFISKLNRLVGLDKDAVDSLLLLRVSVNNLVADDHHILVSENGELTVLGLLNSLLGLDSNGVGLITAVTDENGSILCFKRTYPSMKTLVKMQVERGEI